MVIIRFTDDAAKRRALGWLIGRFSFKSWTGGQMLVPEAALAQLALQDIPFTSEGPATYEQILTSPSKSCCRFGSMTTSQCPAI